MSLLNKFIVYFNVTNKDIYEKMKVYNEYRSFKYKLKQKIVKLKQYEKQQTSSPDE